MTGIPQQFVRTHRPSFFRTTFAALTFAVGLDAFVPSTAWAQTKPEEPSRWGASFSFVPKWTIPTGDSVLAALAEAVVAGGDQGPINVEASDFRIGVVRGKQFGGEWGVSFVKRSYKDGSTQGGFTQSCQGSTPTSPPCYLYGTEYTYGSTVTLTGVEANKFIAIATIKNLVQIGVDIGGGVGSMKGTASRTEASTDFVNGQTIQTMTTAEVDSSELYSFDPELIGRVEFAAGVTLRQGIKARFSAGFSYPGTQSFSFTVMYLFGKMQ
jgi:hypothetical protein